MGYIIKKGTGGGGGGDATAANQVLQLAQDSTEASQQIQIDQIKENSGSASVFKDANDESVFNISGSSAFKARGNVKVFTDDTNISAFVTTAQKSILYKTFINDRTALSIRPNTILCASFTAATAAGVTTLLNNFLNANNVAINSMTSSQSVGSHDLFLLYSVL
jgi:hypothetical protein